MTERRPQARPDFLARYQAGELNDLYGVPAGDVEAGLARPVRHDPDALADALAAQARERGDGSRQLAAIERLRDPRARVVATGQQAGLLLGPTFTLSKALTAIGLAARHDRTDRPVVPVFWVASQDHDAAEIDHTHLLDMDERLHRVHLPFPADLPSGRTPLRPSWREALREQLDRLAVPDVHRHEVGALLDDAWEGAEGVADLFARLLSRLLGERGLVVLDPMHRDVARLSAPLLEAELQGPLAGPAAIREAGEALKARGERPQLGRGEDATNLFMQEPGGPRRLLRMHRGRFHPDGHPERELTVEDLLELLRDDPAAITPAAGLRPIVQDTLLPTAVTVVGPGELRYFSQLRGVYERHGVAMPLVWPRATVTILEPPVVRILARHGLEATEVAADPEGTLHDTLLRLHGHAGRFGTTLARLDEDVAALLAEIDGIDPTLEGPVRHGHAILERTIGRLRSKAATALARRDAETTAQFARLRAHLLPDGRPQERTLSPFSFFLKFGVAPIMDRLDAIAVEGDHALSVDVR